MIAKNQEIAEQNPEPPAADKPEEAPATDKPEKPASPANLPEETPASEPEIPAPPANNPEETPAPETQPVAAVQLVQIDQAEFLKSYHFNPLY